MFHEGIDSSIEVCFKILSPDVEQIDVNTFATVNIEPITGTAVGKHCNICVQHKNYYINIVEGEDYVLPDSYSAVSFLLVGNLRECKMVNLVNDSIVESTESLTFLLELSGDPFAVSGNFTIVLPETTVIIQDDDRILSGVSIRYTACSKYCFQIFGINYLYYIVTLNLMIRERVALMVCSQFIENRLGRK